MRRLLIRPGAIGDFLTSLPALESLRADYTEIWCASQNVPLARFADRVISISDSGLDRLGLLAAEDVVQRLRGFDDIVSWYGANRDEFRSLAEGLGLPFRFCTALPDRVHAVEFYNAQACKLGGACPSRFPRIPVSEQERTFAAIHPFASSAAKRAPLEWFESLAARLETSMPVRWLAGPEEVLPSYLRDGAVRIGDLNELACWLRGARVYIGNDSGITHLAAAVGTPVIACFRGTDERVWSPRGLAWTCRTNS